MTDETAHIYEPRTGHGLRHDPFNAIVGPRPIGWISTRAQGGGANLAPYSFFNALCYLPPLIGFASTGRKDSLANVEATGEFCWNLVTKALGAKMNLTSAGAPSDVDEFMLAGLTAAPSRLVTAPRVKESPVNFECKVAQVIRLHGADGTPADSWFVVGEVVCVYIDPRFIRDGVYQTAETHPILRAGRLGDYIEVRPDAVFEMPRPSWPIA